MKNAIIFSLLVLVSSNLFAQTQKAGFELISGDRLNQEVISPQFGSETAFLPHVASLLGWFDKKNGCLADATYRITVKDLGDYEFVYLQIVYSDHRKFSKTISSSDSYLEQKVEPEQNLSEIQISASSLEMKKSHLNPPRVYLEVRSEKCQQSFGFNALLSQDKFMDAWLLASSAVFEMP